MAARNAGAGNSGNVDLGVVEEEIGAAPRELHPKDKARLVMAYSVLFGVLLLILVSSITYVALSPSSFNAAKEVFEFVKGFGPPLVTLVLGFYFRDAFSGDSNDNQG
jgi:hypothetical protein